MVHRLVELPARGVDLELPEQRVHAEGARLVGHDRRHPGAEVLVSQQRAQQDRERRRGRHLPVAGALVEGGEDLAVGLVQRPAVPHDARRQQAVQRLAAAAHVHHLLGVGRWPVVRRGGVVDERALGDLFPQAQPVAEFEQLAGGHLLDLVGGVAALEPLAQAPALDGLGQDHRRRADVLGGGLVGGVQLLMVVAAAGQVGEVLVAVVGHHGAQARVGAEEVLADVIARLGGVALVLAVDGGVHLVQQQAVVVPLQQVVPA